MCNRTGALQSEWSSFEALLWRGRTTIGSPGSPDDFPDCEDSRARGSALHPQEFHILSFILGIQYPNLID
ncbi:hypothetical protein Tco_0595989 [Tanacetum coccineum]